MCVNLKLKKSYNQRGYLIPHRVETGSLELHRFQLQKAEISAPSCYGYLTVIKSPYYAVQIDYSINNFSRLTDKMTNFSSIV